MTKSRHTLNLKTTLIHEERKEELASDFYENKLTKRALAIKYFGRPTALSALNSLVRLNLSTTKKCRQCEVAKPVEDFGVWPHYGHPSCIQCRKAANYVKPGYICSVGKCASDARYRARRNLRRMQHVEASDEEE